MKTGKIYSLTNYYTEDSINPDGTINLVNSDKTQKVRASKTALEEAFTSGDDFKDTLNINKTELNTLILSSIRTCMTINFDKVEQAKSAKAFKAEKDAKINEVTNAKVSDINKLLDDLIENPITKTIPGENRTIRGYHFGEVDPNGRLVFTDMEEVDKSNRFIPKQVTLSNIKWAILNNRKYVVK